MDYKDQNELKIDSIIASALLTTPYWNDGNLSVSPNELLAIMDLIQKEYPEHYINDDNLTLTDDKQLALQIVFEAQQDCTFYIPERYHLDATIRYNNGRKIKICEWLKSYVYPNYELIDLLRKTDQQKIKRK